MPDESTQTGDLTIDQAAALFRQGAEKPPEELQQVETKEVKTEPTEAPKLEEKAEVQDDEVKTEATEETAKETKTDADEAFFETLDELAEAAGIPLEKMLNLKTRTKVDGVEDAVSLSQIVKSYQLEGHLNRKTQELAEQLKSVEQTREKLTSELTTKLQEANNLTGHLEQQVMAEYNAVNWNDLRQTDPAEFAAKKQEYNDRWGQLQQYKLQASSTYQKMMEENQSKAQEKFSQIVKAEEEKLQAKIPDWKDPEKAKSGKKELSDYLMSDYGFKPEEISQLYDHRVVDIINKARLYDKQSVKTEVAKKKVATLPKLLKPSAKPSDPRAESLKVAMKKLNESGRIEDAAQLIKLKLGVT